MTYQWHEGVSVSKVRNIKIKQNSSNVIILIINFIITLTKDTKTYITMALAVSASADV